MSWFNSTLEAGTASANVNPAALNGMASLSSYSGTTLAIVLLVAIVFAAILAWRFGRYILYGAITLGLFAVAIGLVGGAMYLLYKFIHWNVGEAQSGNWIPFTISVSVAPALAVLAALGYFMSKTKYFAEAEKSWRDAQ